MEDIRPDNGCGMPGIKELRIVHVNEVANVQITAADTVTVNLKTGCAWGKIHGTRMSAVSTGAKSHSNKITAHIAGWPDNADGLSKGRYLAAWIDNHGRNMMCGYGEPMRLTIERTEPEEPAGQYGANITLECESEFGFLKMAQ